MKRAFLSDDPNPDQVGLDGWEERWVDAFASHAFRRFQTRALVRASVGGAEPVPLAYIYSLRGAGLVLVIAADDAPDPGGHDHDAGHDHAGESATAAHRELWSGSRGAGTHEIWISRPDQAVFHVERPPEGAFSTGFGRLGISRTPDLILARTTATPEEKGHRHHF